jgi:hypothetical protein
MDAVLLNTITTTHFAYEGGGGGDWALIVNRFRSTIMKINACLV